MFKLYQMIWQRFVGSQMLPAVFDQTTIDISADDYTFRVVPCRNSTASSRRISPCRKEEDKKEDAADSAGNGLPQVKEGWKSAGLKQFAPTSTSPSRRRATPKRRW